MRLIAGLAGLCFIAIVLWDAFETVVLPRTVTRRVRLARVYFRWTWRTWTAAARRFDVDARRERFLAVFGPLSLVGLLSVWAMMIVFGFGALQWSIGSRFRAEQPRIAFADDLYVSGTSFFTLGYDDLHPAGALARALTVIEGGMGFGLLAVVISYFPVLYQSFSKREVRLTLLDAWAGSPPSAGEILGRCARANELAALERFLRAWEYWCSELLESHISYPVVAFFRSQHQRQSWVSALTAVLDLSALGIVGIEGMSGWQAQTTFAIARHAAVDLTQVLYAEPDPTVDRLNAADLDELRRELEAAGLILRRSADADARLAALRRSYEPFVAGLSRSLMMPLPPWRRQRPAKDNWETSPRRAHL